MQWKTILITIVAMGLLVGTAHAVLIDFDDIPPGSFSGDRYLSEGVLLSTDGILGLWAALAAAPTNTPPNFIYGAEVHVADSNIIIDFVVPGTTIPAVTDAVSFYLYDADIGVGAPWSAQVFDIDLNLLTGIMDTTNDEIQLSFGTSPNPAIHRLVFSPSIDRDGIDTLEFNAPVAPVPEPSTLLLLGFGLAGVGLFRRKFKK